MGAVMRVILMMLVSLSVASLSAGRGQPKFRIVLRLRDLEDCGKDKAYAHLDYYTIVQRRDGGHSINGNVTLDRPCAGGRAAHMKLFRCREALSYCEYYTTWSWRTALCSMMVLKNVLWSPVVQSFTPPLVCPIKKGTYTLTNATIDLDNVMVRTIIDGYVWRGVFTVFDQGNEMVLCLQGALQGLKVRA